jgi:MFS family permease
VFVNAASYYGHCVSNVLTYQFQMSPRLQKVPPENTPSAPSGTVGGRPESPVNRPLKLAQDMGLRRSIVGILCMAVLVGMGERMSERFLPIYLIALGSGMLWPGFLNAINNLVSALYSFPGGWLAERIGAKRSLLVFNLMAIAGFALVAAIPKWQAVVAGSFLFLSWSAISLPGTMGLVSKTLPKQKHVMGVTWHSLVRRFPMALGPIVGGIFIDRYGPVTGVRLAFGAAIIMAIVALVAQQILIENDEKPSGEEFENNPLKLVAGFAPALRNLLVSDILIRFCEQIPYAYVVLWCMASVPGKATAHISALQFGELTSIEMLTAVLCYIPVARSADRVGKKPFVVITFINFACFPLVLYFCHSFGALIIAFIVRGLKEFGEPTRKALIMHLAPENRKAGAFGAYYLCRDTIVCLSAFAGAFLWKAGPEANFMTAFAFGVIGAIWFALKGRENTDLPDSLTVAAQ